jgi:ABC-2 type transport system ATP-binding protein
MEAIRCEGLSRRYGKVEALKSLDLTVQPGTIFGFLGRNGAGKTTTIRLLTGLARPTSGTAWVDGVRTTDGDDRARQRFGYLPEEPAFYSWMTPREFLDYVGRLFELDKTERKRRIDRLLELTDLEDASNRRIGGFSRGMRQRLGLAQALIHEPPVLFLDEPTSALDPAGRRDVLELIDRLRGDTTVFLSSHILADVEKVCERVGVVHEGQLLLVADRDELLARYPTNIVLLRFDSQNEIALQDFLIWLEEQHWFSGMLNEENGIRLTVTSPDVAKGAIVPKVVESRLVLTHYEWVRPSLEEVFLSISAEPAEVNER